MVVAIQDGEQRTSVNRRVRGGVYVVLFYRYGVIPDSNELRAPRGRCRIHNSIPTCLLISMAFSNGTSWVWDERGRPVPPVNRKGFGQGRAVRIHLLDSADLECDFLALCGCERRV